MIFEGILIANVLHSVMWYDYTEKGFYYTTKGGFKSMKEPDEKEEVVSNELELEIEEMDQLIAPGALLSD